MTTYRRLTLSLALTALVVGGLAVDSLAAGPPGGKISGYVMYGEVKATPLKGVRLLVTKDGRPETLATTNENGYYKIEQLSGGTYDISIDEPKYNPARASVRVRGGKAASQNFNLLDRAAAGSTEYRVTLSWCDEKSGAVSDVDTYLSIPGASVPLYYSVKAKEYEGTHLDVDDTGWRGPETTTIKDLRRGTYVFYVNNYSGRTDLRALGRSEVTVQVYRGQQQVRSYRIGSGRGITYEVFRIEVGSGGARTVDIEKYNDSLWVSGR